MPNRLLALIVRVCADVPSIAASCCVFVCKLRLNVWSLATRALILEFSALMFTLSRQ